MSKRIYVIFKPSDDILSLKDMEKKINSIFPNTAVIEDDSLSLNNEWLSYIDRCVNVYDYSDFPYWQIYFWCYWDVVLHNVAFRTYIMNLCTALGANHWWYIEETSMELFDNLNTVDFETALNEAKGIEDFEIPRYFPHSKNHIFSDSVERVLSICH